MTASTYRPLVLALAACVALASCADHRTTAPAIAPAFSIDREAFYERLAHPMVSDWSSTRLTSVAVDKLRAQAPKAAERRIQTLSSVTNFSSAGVNATGSTGKISSAPCVSYWSQEAFWLTETGWVIKRTATGTLSAYRISTSDTFANTCLTLSNDGLRGYAVSRQGNFFAFLTSNGTQLTGSPYAIGGTSGLITNNSCAPVVDPLASRNDGQIETVYALSATGTLHRFYVNAPHEAATSTWSIARPQTYALPVNNTAPYTEVFRAHPVVIGGKVTVGSWRSNSSNSAQDNGSLFYYDTGMGGVPASATAASITGVSRVMSVGAPIWASTAVEFDDNLTPVYAFVPTGYVISMIELATGSQVQSVPLLTSLNSATQGGPVSGMLSTYPYGTSGITTVTKPTVTNGLITIADNNTVTDLSGTWRLLNTIAGAETYDDDTKLYPIWGYAKFFVSGADAVVGGTVRAIINASVVLQCSQSSNANGNANPAPKPVQMFRVSNNLTNGTAWDSTNMTPATRPAFEDSQTFSLAKLASHGGVELVNAGNAFKNNQSYAWGATGLVAATNANYSFGLMAQGQTFSNLASNNGQPHRIQTPLFSNANIQLTLSGQGLTTPTITTPVTIDSWNRRIYALNTNTLYSASYASPTYDATGTPFDPLSFTERYTNFCDAAQTSFSLTKLGQSNGPVSGTSFVANDTAPLFTGSSVYVVDSYPGNNSQTICRFIPGAPAALQADSVTLSGTADGRRGATYMSYDYVNAKIIAGTYDGAASTGRCWVINQ